MPELSSYSISSYSEKSWKESLVQASVFVYLLLALATFAFIPISAESWFRTPFIGGLVDQSMVFTDSNSIEKPSRWEARNQGLAFGYRLSAVNGKAVHNAEELSSLLSSKRVGDPVVLNVIMPDGTARDFTVHLIEFPGSDRQGFLYIPFLIGVVFWIGAVWAFLSRRTHAGNRTFAVFFASVAITIGGLFDQGTTHHLTLLWAWAVPLAGTALINLAFLFPQKDPILSKYPWIPNGVFLLGLLVAGYSTFRLFGAIQPATFDLDRRVGYLLAIAGFAFPTGWAIFRRLRISSSLEKEQICLVLAAGLLSFGPLVLWLLGSLLWVDRFSFHPYLLIPLILFPAVVVYTEQRRRLGQGGYFLSRALLYGVLAVFISAGYALLVSGLSMLAGYFIPIEQPLLSGLVFFTLALLINPLRTHLQNLIDRVFFRGERAYRERLQKFANELSQAVDLNGILRILREDIERSLTPSNLHIFIYDPQGDQYIASAGEGNRLTSDLRFSSSSILVQALNERKSSISAAELAGFRTKLQSDHTRLQLLRPNILVPLVGNQQLAGWISLGTRLSGDEYSARDVRFLETISSQAALALERAQVVSNLENRVREMNTLARVAQGINVTLTLDDVLELIYAQTTQVIPADDFHLILLDHEAGLPVQLFCVERNERLVERENQPLVGSRRLELEVIRGSRQIITEDYARELQRHGMIETMPVIFAWVGVPLNAGAETIGALSIGKRDPSISYTREQANLLQAIADQAAGALVKARLLQETEQRARQLSTLNEVSRQLTSTLDISVLLRTILQSATDILNCEAGSLLLVDEQTDELVFRETVGPVAADLLHRRLPPGSGFVGKAVRLRQPVIENNPQLSTTWFSSADKQTGFQTLSLMAVPMEFKERVIGVIEVINRRDGLQFSADDEALLVAFAAQAAVAFENARLYTLTDQALEARVQELSVMQRIDRELNASLDTSRAMKITLDWAMRQTSSNAGVIATIEEKNLKVIEAQGYTGELEPFGEGFVPLELFKLVQVVESGNPRAVSFTTGEDTNAHLLENCGSQLAVPIRRESATIALLLLESDLQDHYSEEIIQFLVRLGDHAAIAIANAKLYAAVQSANVAKSEFVSFVSHELKNPMTSIKGYTELLAAGAVGPVNEAQANFLSTIRSNVDRMSTLVSDLADVSRIEAGRLRLDFKPWGLKEIVDEVVRSMKRQVEEKKQVFKLQLAPDLPDIWADRIRILQIITNLVSNAHKYTPAGGEFLAAAEVCENRWDPEGAPRVIHLWVKDNGIGISEDDQVKIFQKFFRSEDPMTREMTGTGLGLNITRSLVEMQGGKIWFESEFRKGTTFHFTVPVADPPA